MCRLCLSKYKLKKSGKQDPLTPLYWQGFRFVEHIRGSSDLGTKPLESQRLYHLGIIEDPLNF